ISIVLKEMTAVLPPARTIFRRRSLMLSSLMAPTRVHPGASAGSVVRRTLAIALISSSARADVIEATSASVTEARRAITRKVRVFNGQLPTIDRLLFGVDLNPADRQKPTVATPTTPPPKKARPTKPGHSQNPKTPALHNSLTEKPYKQACEPFRLDAS